MKNIVLQIADRRRDFARRSLPPLFRLRLAPSGRPYIYQGFRRFLRTHSEIPFAGTRYAKTRGGMGADLATDLSQNRKTN